MKRAFSLAAVVLFLSFSTVSRGDEVLFSDNFESYPPGASLTGNYGGWVPLYYSLNDPGNNIYTNQQSSDNGVSIQLYGAHSFSWAAGVYHQVSFPAEFVLEFDMMASGDIYTSYPYVPADHQHDIAVSLYSDFEPWGHGLGVAIYGVDNLTTLPPIPMWGDRVPLRWYHFRTKIDRILGNVDYWIDGVYKGRINEPAYLTWGPTLQYLYIQSGAGKGWIDRVRVYTDNTAPTTTASVSGVPGENGWFLSDVQVTLTATDNASGVAGTEYSFDAGGTWHTYTGPFTVTAEGTTVIDYRSVDALGNVEPFMIEEVNIDRIPPAVVATDPAADATDVPRGQTVALTFSENVVPGNNILNAKLYRGRVGPTREVAVSRAAAGRLLTLDPVESLSRGTRYLVVVPADAVKDAAGHPLAADYPVYSFSTSR